jgi:hypothetical protein
VAAIDNDRRSAGPLTDHGGLRMGFISRAAVTGFAGLALAVGPAAAQTPPTSDEGPTTRDSTVGYIDSALPGSEFRVRFDSYKNMTRPNRVEFFYPRGAPQGPGFEDPERRVDFQQLSAYLEVAFGGRFSAFAEVPVTFLNPQVNDNAAGLSDVNAGFKWAFLRDDEQVLTAQLRVYAPTGDVNSALSTGHASVEPALLYYRRLGERLTFEGELRYWTAVGGTDVAGDLLRYGAGLGFELCRTENVRFCPVVEVVGWTILGGRESFTTPAGDVVEQGAAGETIVNVKLGLRTYVGRHMDVYAGYGRALTGTRWYEDVARLEVRWTF